MTQHVPDVHAKFSPSAAHRWMRCRGSLLAESLLPSRGSSGYAREGTAAHELAAWTLSSDHKNTESYLGRVIEVEGDKIHVTQDMCDYIQEYVDDVLDYAQGGKLKVEVQVDFSDAIDIPNSFGTSDVVIVKPKELIVIDLKYGRGVQVDPRDNEQLMLYALGALELFDVFDDIEHVTMVIHMPRKNGLSEWTVSKAELYEFAEEVKKKAKAASAVFELADNDPNFELEDHLNPSTKACQWCDFKAQCPALGNEVINTVTGGHRGTAAVTENPEAVKVEIVDCVDGLPKRDAQELGSLMQVTDLIEGWVKAVRQQVIDQLSAGEQVEGFKLVRGRKGPRQWTDKADAETMLKSMRLKLGEMYNQTVISPTQAEKLLKDNKRRWTRLQSVITQSDGSLSVAPEGDKRPAVVIETAEADEFAPIKETTHDFI